MYLHALANRVPPASYCQKDIWEIHQKSATRHRLSDASNRLIEKVLLGDNGVEKRHFALEEVAAIPSLDAETLNRRFEDEAPKLARRALEAALDVARLRPEELDALVVCTCTGYLCPGVTSHVAEQAGLRRDAFLLDLVGLGCGAAIPALRNAASLTAASPAAMVAVVAVEICSAAFYLDDDPGVIVSACLFGDGASASIWSARPPDSENFPLRIGDFDTWHEPENRSILRFENRQGKLRNLLRLSVPANAARSVTGLYERSLKRLARPIARVVSHTGGRDVLLAIEKAIPGADLGPSKRALGQYGNQSSPSALFALEEALAEGAPEPSEDWWLTAFGAGFAAHSCRLSLD